MNLRKSARTLLLVAALAASVVASCFAEPGPYVEPPLHTAGTGGNRGGETSSDGGVPNAGNGGNAGDFSGNDAGDPGKAGETSTPVGKCLSVTGSESLPARAVVSSNETPTDSPYFTANLFALFDSTCGGCHGATAAGGFQVKLSNFANVVTADVLKSIRGEREPTMPPGDVHFADRSPDDPVVKLAAQLEIWQSQGSPSDVFMLPASAGGQSLFHMPEALGAKLTNLGTCIAERTLVNTDRERMLQLDEMFENLERAAPGTGTLAERVGLPVRLDATDLASMDSEVLAKQGVIAFSPLYPLWSDGSGKLRYVRVPVGKHIRFDPETKDFDIPANTRFYKTFLKKTIQTDGTIAFRKVETRLIVSRPDKKLEDGTFEPQALFGTYVWNDAETEATLLTNPYRNGEPFADLVNVLVLDEPGAQKVRDRNPRNLAYAMEDAGVLRRYGVPGSARCIECHMGSHSQSFVLGFTPMQLARRPKGEGGAIEESTSDELTQLARLIDYGIISNMKPSDAPKLEDSQLPRKPRTEQELTAQGYMFGNCGHCHNPRGFASISNPALAPLLYFWPSKEGGIFEFPLERVSPRIKRGEAQDVDLPYITPSLRELFPPNYITDSASTNWTPKVETPTEANPLGGRIAAPWRSIIYRNVDTPFTYSDGYAIFPHMPRHTSGYDCRAPKIMADWMVSIPAKLKDPFKYQDSAPCDASDPRCLADFSTQPYAEVKRGEDGYEKAQEDAEKRLTEYHASSRYTNYCPSGLDILDRGVLEGQRVVPEDDTVSGFPDDSVPDRPHFASFDLTENPGDWLPRRSDWVKFLARKELEPPRDGITQTELDLFLKANAVKLQVLDTVQRIKLSDMTDFVDYALKPVPFALWQKKDGCDFSSEKKVSDFSGSDVPSWMNGRTLDPADPVYMETPAAAVYGMICINCHGVNADSKGRQAATLSDMTGGAARVANLRDGFFGGSGANIQRAFADEAELPVTAPANWLGGAWPGGVAEDWAARYLAWMALGGTQQKIPDAVTNLVLNTQVFGESRPDAAGIVVSANMLAVAQLFCTQFLPEQGVEIARGSGASTDLLFEYKNILDRSRLIASNGDQELWQTLCHFDNPSPVRALFRTSDNWEQLIATPEAFYGRAEYPATAPVGDQHGNVSAGIASGNIFPWCFKINSERDAAEVSSHTVNGQPIPVCPPEVLAESNHWLGDVNGARPPEGDYRDDHRRWTTRGAVNAGLAVFLNLREISLGHAVPKPRYDECERLAGTAAN